MVKLNTKTKFELAGGENLLPKIPLKGGVGKGELSGELATIKEDMRSLELKETNLTRKRAFKAVAEALEATTLIMDKFGNVIDEVPDHKSRLAAAEKALEILRDNEGVGGVKLSPMIIKLSDGTMIGLGGK